MQMVNFMT